MNEPLILPSYGCGFYGPWHESIPMRLEEPVGPTYEPVTLAFVRDEHLKVLNGTVEDNWITRAIATARRMAEIRTQRPLVPRQFVLDMERFPRAHQRGRSVHSVIVLPRPPLQSVDAVTYVDPDGNTQTLAADQYQVSKPSGPTADYGEIAPAFGTYWPQTRAQLGAVRITFTAGYPEVGSPATADVPSDIVSGMLLAIGELYKQRSLSIDGRLTESILRARDLWKGYQVY